MRQRQLVRFHGSAGSVLFFVLLVANLATVVAFAQQPRVRGPESKNMALVGTDTLQGRSAYQPVIHHQGNRWVAYVGLHIGKAVNPLTGAEEGNGTMVVDVTDPRRPQALAHIPGDHANPGKETQAQMVRACDIAGGTYLLRAAGNNSLHDL